MIPPPLPASLIERSVSPNVSRRDGAMRQSDATRRIETRQDDKERRKRNVEHGSPYLQTGMIRHTAQENTARNNKTACWTPETHKRYEVKKNGMLQDEIGDSRRNATRNGTPRGGTHHHGTHRPHGDGNTHTPPRRRTPITQRRHRPPRRPLRTTT